MAKIRSFKCSECQRIVSCFYVKGIGYDKMQFDKILCYDCWKFHRDSGKKMFEYGYYSNSDIFKLEEAKEKIKEQEELKNKIIQMGIDYWVEDIERRYIKDAERQSLRAYRCLGTYCPDTIRDEIKNAPSEYISKLVSKNVQYHYHWEEESYIDDNGWNYNEYDVTWRLNDVINKIIYGF